MDEIPVLYLLVILEVFLLAVVVLPAVVLGCLYSFSDQMAASLGQGLAKVQRRLDQDRNAIDILQTRSLPFRGQVDAPFGARANALARAMADASTRCEAVQNRHARLSEGLPATKAPGQDLWQRAGLGGAWGAAWLRCQVLSGDVLILNRQIRQASRRLDQVLAVKASVAREFRQVLELKAAGQLHGGLVLLKLQGQAFAQAAAEKEQLDRMCARVPPGFYTPPLRVPRTNADIREVTRVYHLTRHLKRGYTGLIRRYEQWGNQFKDLNKSLAGTQRELASLLALRSALPVGLDMPEVFEQVHDSSRHFRRLTTFAGQPDVQEVARVKVDSQAMKTTLLVLQRELKQARALHQKWVKAVAETGVLVDRLMTMIAAQADPRQDYPLAWGETGARSAQIAADFQTVQGHAQKIDSLQIQQDLRTCGQIKNSCKRLAGDCARQARRRAQLIGLWASLARVFEPDWLAKKNTLETEARRFAVDNWDAALDVQSFLPDGVQIIAELRSVLPPGPANAIQEAELESGLAYARQASTYLEAYETRVGRIDDQMKRVWDAEREASHTLTFLLPQLDNLLALFGTPDQFQAGPDDLAVQVIHEITQAKAYGKAYGEELNRREAGQVIQKHRNIQAWAEAVVERCTEITRVTGQEIVRQRGEISSRLVELRAIALLSGDPLIEFAYQALDATAQANPGQVHPSGPELDQVMAAITDQIEVNLNQRAMLRQVNSQLEALLQPVREPAQAVQRLIGEIDAQLQRVQALNHGSRWPPTFIDMAGVNNRHTALMAQLADAIQTSTRESLKIRYDSLRWECQRVLRQLSEDVRAAEVREETIQFHTGRVRALIEQKRPPMGGYPAETATAARFSATRDRWDAINRSWETLIRGSFRGMSYHDLLVTLTGLEEQLSGLPSSE